MELTLEQALQKGIEAHKAGKVQEADQYYTAILKANSKHPDANHNMGVLAVGVSKVQEALPFFKTALEANPNIAQYWLSYVDALIKLDRLDDAKAVFDQAKSKGAKGDAFDQIEKRLGSTPAKNSNTQEPPQKELNALIKLYNENRLVQAFDEAQKLTKRYTESLILWNLMGASAAQIGQLDDAILAFEKAISIKPDYAEAYNNMGLALKDQGKVKEATEAYNKALSIKPDFADAYHNAGNILQEQGKLDEAIQAYSKALSIKPDNADAYNNMGVALKDQDNLEEAIEAYNKAVSIKPDYAEAYYNAGNVFQEQGMLDKTIEAYTKALSINPDYPEAYFNLGNALKDQCKLGEALEAYNKAVSIKPDYAEAYKNMGFILKEHGKFVEAIEAYTKALSIKPDYAQAHRNLSSIKEYTKLDTQFLQVQEYYDQEDMSDDDKCHFSFALAKMYEDIGDLKNSFACLIKGNSLRKQLLNYSVDQDKRIFNELKITQPYLLKNALGIEESSTDPTPIFIIGMPRSGTTLVEQIISSHSEVLGAGELDHVSQLGVRLSVDPKAINAEAISKFRKTYLSELSKLSNGKQFVTDKMPQNFRFIPLICASLPEAKIIHIDRNAAATCWSNFKRYFVSDGLGYCYDLNDLVTYYELYTDLMKLWQSQYGDRIYNLNYERLTTDQENQTRKLIKYLELNWERACLSPQKNKRSVRTASQQQVRQKVYKGSSEVWRKFEPYLNGAFDSLLSL